MDVHYILFRCTAWQREPTMLIQEHEKQVSLWSATVRQLPELRKTTPALLKFRVITRAERTPRVQEPAQEERRSGRDEAWGLEEKRLEKNDNELGGNREAEGGKSE